jgi:hypothetical protein
MNGVVNSDRRFSPRAAMGTSFVKYGEFGFWTRDTHLSSWLMAASDELCKVPQLETWQSSLIEHWRVQINVDGGCMSAGLDEFLTDAKRRDSIVSISNAALRDCEPIAKRTGELFVALLLGDLMTTASSPIDYLGDTP